MSRGVHRARVVRVREMQHLQRRVAVAVGRQHEPAERRVRGIADRLPFLADEPRQQCIPCRDRLAIELDRDRLDLGRTYAVVGDLPGKTRAFAAVLVAAADRDVGPHAGARLRLHHASLINAQPAYQQADQYGGDAAHFGQAHPAAGDCGGRIGKRSRVTRASGLCEGGGVTRSSRARSSGGNLPHTLDSKKQPRTQVSPASGVSAPDWAFHRQGSTMKKWLTTNRGILVFLLCLGFFRTAVADWNTIRSGSMRPTLLEGDVVLVNRLAYDLKVPLTDRSLARLGDPQRGDIVTFTSPKDGTRLIKRLIAIPGDIVEMRNEVLIVNGVAAEYADITAMKEPAGNGEPLDGAHASEQVAGSRRRVQFLARANSRRSFDATTVPADQYFMLGDNRDNSEDSRYIGFVPRAALIGRAERVLVSADIKGNWHPRLERTVTPLM